MNKKELRLFAEKQSFILQNSYIDADFSRIPDSELTKKLLLHRDIQLIPTLYFLKTTKYQIVLRENWSRRIIGCVFAIKKVKCES